MALDNMESLLKTIETGDMIGGQGALQREQQRQFIVLIKRFTSLIRETRSVVMPQASMDINKLHIGEPVTVAVSENTNPAQDNRVKPNQVHLDAKKLRSTHDITTETLQQNIEGEEFEMTVMRAFAARMAHDMELLALRGDESLVPGAGDKLGNLLVSNNGWRKLAEESHVLDLNGAEIEPGIFSEMLRMLPVQYRGDPGLRFIVGETTVIDWQDTLQGRATPLGDAALGAQGPSRAPYGRKFLVAPLVPDDEPLTVQESVAAHMVGTAFGPYTIVPTVNDQLSITVNGGAPLLITLVTDALSNPTTAGSNLETITVVAQINAAMQVASVRAIAFDDGTGLLNIKTLDKGAARSLQITPVVGRDATQTLGLTNGIAPAFAAGSDNSGVVREGSYIMLCNPRNLIWSILAGTRMFTEFNKDFDRIEMVTYNQVDMQIENKDAMVLATNLRRKRHVATSTP